MDEALAKIHFASLTPLRSRRAGYFPRIRLCNQDNDLPRLGISMTCGSEICNLATVTKAPLSGLGLETVNVPSSPKLWLRKPFRTALDNTHLPAAGPAASLGCLGRHGPTSASSITARDQTEVQHSDGGRGRRGAAAPASEVCVYHYSTKVIPNHRRPGGSTCNTS